jgi:signal peptidase I
MRVLLRVAVIGVIVALVLVVLGFAQLLVWPAQHKAAMAPAIPSCGGRVVAEGLTYKFSDPHPGDVVVIHAARNPDGTIIPDKDATDIDLVLRVAAGPNDEIVGRDGAVFVNNVKFDEIETAPFGKVTLGGDQYFVLGDNRSAAVDSRVFGPVQRSDIYARALLSVWPLPDFGLLGDRVTGAPPGPAGCK